MLLVLVYLAVVLVVAEEGVVLKFDAAGRRQIVESKSVAFLKMNPVSELS
jgi:hypothetical protein